MFQETKTYATGEGLTHLDGPLVGALQQVGGAARLPAAQCAHHGRPLGGVGVVKLVVQLPVAPAVVGAPVDHHLEGLGVSRADLRGEMIDSGRPNRLKRASGYDQTLA